MAIQLEFQFGLLDSLRRFGLLLVGYSDALRTAVLCTSLLQRMPHHDEPTSGCKHMHVIRTSATEVSALLLGRRVSERAHISIFTVALGSGSPSIL